MGRVIGSQCLRDSERIRHRKTAGYKWFSCLFKFQKLSDIQRDSKAVSAMQQMSQAAEENGTADMALEKINKEIQAVRQGR